MPTVVGCAAWKCVQASVGVSASRAANSESAVITGKQFAADELPRCAHLQKVGVIVHIAARRAEMDDACGLRAGIAERADVRHHVVAQPVLILGGTVKIDIVEMRRAFPQAARP